MIWFLLLREERGTTVVSDTGLTLHRHLAHPRYLPYLVSEDFVAYELPKTRFRDGREEDEGGKRACKVVYCSEIDEFMGARHWIRIAFPPIFPWLGIEGEGEGEVEGVEEIHPGYFCFCFCCSQMKRKRKEAGSG
ncbi:uncharacterized protein RSE6_13808 [Rhynchosporium secalis]|uniref:Uncharacterized protein n=1 Tax=Rhynchosporium secalis TaxID=38038 RepID=A0A1E1MTT1_RHYSE|nr:uncharacterized protein RSE6_13808 [Rhynchosporium secalis]